MTGTRWSVPSQNAGPRRIFDTRDRTNALPSLPPEGGALCINVPARIRAGVPGDGDPYRDTPEGGGKPVLVEVDSKVEAVAEVNFVPNEDGCSKREGTVRCIAVRRNRRLRRRGCRNGWTSTMTNCCPTTANRPLPSAC